MRRGQIWSSDLALSLVIFTLVTIMSYFLITTFLDDNAYEMVRIQAETGSRVLATEGYPIYWTATDVQRAGLRSDNRLSSRKVVEIANLSTNNLRSKLRLTDNFLLHFVNSTNDTVALFGSCSVGDIAIPSTPKNVSLPTLAIVGRNADHEYIDALASRVPLVVQYPEQAIGNLSSYERIILEGNITVGTTVSIESIIVALDSIARRGTTIIIIGNPGFGLFGIHLNDTSVDTIEILENDKLDIGVVGPVSLSAAHNIDTIELNSTHVHNIESIVTADGKLAYAWWLYDDAPVYYFADFDGPLHDQILADLVNRTQTLYNISRPDCGAVTLPTNAKQIVHYDRALLHHDQLYTVRLYVWRTR